MPSNFPGSLDNLTNPNPGDQTTSATVPHASQHTNINDIVEAIEAKLGIGAGGPPASAAVLRRTATGTSLWGQIQTADIGADQITSALLAPNTITAADLATGVVQPRTATLVVAASNASAAIRAQADYLCDGTADEVEINAALNALPASGGTVLLSEGTFTIAAPITTAKLGSSLIGSGMGATTIMVVNAGGAPINTSLINLNHTACRLADLKIDGNKANNASATSMFCVWLSGHYVCAERVRVVNSAAYGFLSNATFLNIRLTGCVAETSLNYGFLLRGTTGSPTLAESCVANGNVGGGFNMDNGAVELDHCIAEFQTGAGAPGFTSSQDNVRYTACAALNNPGMGFQITGVRVSVVGCLSRSNGGSGIAIGGAVSLVSQCLISVNNTANTGNAGIDNSGADMLFVGNQIQQNGQHGIRQVGDRCAFIGNRIMDNGTMAATTYSGIVIAANDTYVQGNQIRKGTAAANKQVLGIQIVNGSNNYLGSNDLYDSGTSGEITDATTTTRRVVKLLYDFVQGNDLFTNTPFSAGGWGTIGTPPNFTVTSLNSLIVISVRGGILATATAIGSAGARVLVDGSKAWALAGGRIPTTGTLHSFPIVGVVTFSGLTVGAHSMVIQASFESGANVYARAASAPTSEPMQVTVTEYMP